MTERVIWASSTVVEEPTIFCMCGVPACVFLSVHAADKCQFEETASQFFCAECLVGYLGMAQDIADDGGESCATCGLVFVNLCDIVVRICPIGKR